MELYYQWGCGGTHHGTGEPDCPRHLHHHHDERCDPPPIVRLFEFMARRTIIGDSVSTTEPNYWEEAS